MSQKNSNSPLQRFLKRVTVDWSGRITVVLIVLAFLGFYFGSAVKLKLSLMDLLPDDHPVVVKFNKLTEVVGGVGFFAIVLSGEPDQLMATAPKVVAELERSPMVRSAFYHRERRFFMDRMLYYMDVPKLRELETSIKRQVRDSKREFFDLGLFDDEAKKKTDEKPAFDAEMTELAKKTAKTTPYLTSSDGKHILIMAKPSFDSTDLGRTKELVDYSKEVLQKTLPPGVTYRFGERYYNKVLETELIQNDIGVLGILSIVLIMLVLLLYMRSFRALAIIFTPVLMGLGITVGITWLWIGHINIITGFLVGILSGLGVDYSVHLFLRLRLERTEPTGNEPNIYWRTISSTGHSIFVGAAAAAFTFYLLSFSSFRAFSEFGFVCGTGITAVFVCLLLSFSSLAKFFKAESIPIPPPLLGKRLFPMIPVPKGLAIALAVTFVVMLCASKVGFQYDFEKMMKHSKEMEETTALINDVYQRSAVPAAVSTQSREEALAVEAMFKEKYIPSVVEEIVSGATIVPKDQAEKKRILDRIRADLAPIKDRWIEKSMGIPGGAVRTWVSSNPFEFKDIPRHLQDALRGTTNEGYLLYIYPSIGQGNAKDIATYAAMFKDVEAKFPDLLTGSDVVIFSDILDLIKRDGSVILAVIFLAVGFFIWLNTRRVSDTLACYLPLLLSFVVGMGLMAICGVQFNILNITIIPSFVALGIDVPIHLVHRARETGSGFKAARDMAPSINLAMGTSAIGFGILVFARAGVLRSLGEIALMGTLAIWWVGMWLLAAVIEWYLTRQTKKPTQTAPRVQDEPALESH